jgi:hypothetical protein
MWYLSGEIIILCMLFVFSKTLVNLINLDIFAGLCIYRETSRSFGKRLYVSIQ